MKIIVNQENNQKVYIQKRDILYLKRIGEEHLPEVDIHSFDEVEASSFIELDGEQAVSYFKDRKDIIDYVDYLAMPSQDLVPYGIYPVESYPYQMLEDLHLEREQIKGLPYPLHDENMKKLLHFENEKASYEFLMSKEIPSLFCFKKMSVDPYITEHNIPWAFVTKCKVVANNQTLKENFVLVPTNQRGMLLYMPTPEEKNKEEEKPKSKSYLRRFIDTFRK